MPIACTHQLDDFGYPISPNKCERCKALSLYMNNLYIQGVFDGVDIDRPLASRAWPYAGEEDQEEW